MTALAQFYALYSHRARSFNQWQRALYPNFIINFPKARALRHTCALLKYNARNLRHRYERAQFTIPFIKEIKNFFLRTLLNYLSTWEFFQNTRDVREDSPSARAFPHLSSVFPSAYITQQYSRKQFFFISFVIGMRHTWLNSYSRLRFWMQSKSQCEE